MSRPAHSFLKVVIGIFINPQKEILVALRPLHNPHGGLWEFPGGKSEINETPFDALKREIYEEVGVEVIKATPFICVEHIYDSTLVELDAWHIESWEGIPYGRENQEIRWVSYETLSQLDFPAGNRKIIQEMPALLRSDVFV
jgi:8-oxo-dGTP diphosphatase